MQHNIMWGKWKGIIITKHKMLKGNGNNVNKTKQSSNKNNKGGFA